MTDIPPSEQAGLTEWDFPEPTEAEAREAIDAVRQQQAVTRAREVEMAAAIDEVEEHDELEDARAIRMVDVQEAIDLEVLAEWPAEAAQLIQRLRHTVIFRDGQVTGLLAGAGRESQWPPEVVGHLFHLERKYLTTEAWPDVQFLLELNNRQFGQLRDVRAVLEKVKASLIEVRTTLMASPTWNDPGEDIFGLPANEWNDFPDEATRQRAREVLADALAAADYPALARQVDEELGEDR